MKKRIIPAPGKILLKEYKEELKPGSLIIPNTKSTKLYQIIGKYEDCSYDFDEIVCLTGYPSMIEIDGDVYYITNEEDILCSVIDNDEE